MVGPPWQRNKSNSILSNVNNGVFLVVAKVRRQPTQHVHSYRHVCDAEIESLSMTTCTYVDALSSNEEREETQVGIATVQKEAKVG